jgi:hypothetical protein
VNQYYYKNDKCKADSARSKDCICWHDEGTGPLVDERHDYKHCHTRNLLWRVKPDELADWKRLCEERQQKLDEMATVLSRQQDHIKRLEDELMDVKNKYAVLVADVVLNEDRAKRIKRLEEAVEAYRTAYTPDGHVAPHDCFATGPRTGNPIQDLIACPGCWAERKAKEAKL